MTTNSNSSLTLKMGLQIPCNKLEDNDQQICTNVDASFIKTDPRDLRLDIQFDSDVKKFSSQSNNNESYVTPLLSKSISEQDSRKQILRSWASFILSTDISIVLFYNIWSTLFPLEKQNIYLLSIWESFLGLFAFMLFVSALAIMILVGGVFTCIQKAMLIILLLWMHIQSANSIIEVCVILLGGVFMAWYAFWKEESPDNENDIKSSNMLDNKLSAQTTV